MPGSSESFTSTSAAVASRPLLFSRRVVSQLEEAVDDRTALLGCLDVTHNEALERRLAEMFDGHAWHGPPLLATLRDLTPAQAAATPVAGAHSIWALALHLDTWQRVVARRLAGDDSPVGDAENFPAVPPPGPAAWSAALARLAESDAAIRAAVTGSEPARLDPGSDRFDERLYRNVLGAISHLAWHAGQIAILRRAQGLEPTAPEA